MQSRTPVPSSPSITISDIYYVLFKHKWMILLFSALGIGAAAALLVLQPPAYVSEAKLLIRYVEDSKAPAVPSGDTQIRPPSPNGEGVLDTEATILTSLDVAAKAAETIGIDRIIGPLGGTNSEVAALQIRKSLEVEVPRKGNVLRITYQNTDKALVQPVLRAIIQTYYVKHVEYHRNLGVYNDFLTQEVDNLRQSLSQTEEDLRRLKSKAGVVSLDETRKAYSDRFSRMREDLDNAEADLNGRVAALKELQRAAAGHAAAETISATNSVAELKPKLAPDLVSDYKRLVARLEAAFRQQEDLLSKFTEENALVKANKGFIASLESQKKEMEAKNPSLADEQTGISATHSGERHEAGTTDLTLESARVEALKARVQTLTEQSEKLKAEAGRVDAIETDYLALQRKKEMQEKQYKYYLTSLDQLHVDSQLDAGKANISEIQSPSLPLRDMKPLQKKLAAAVFGGIGGGIGLAFLLELVLAQTVRKPNEVESNFNVPVFMTIPEIKLLTKNRSVGALKNGSIAALPPPSNSTDPGERGMIRADLNGGVALDEAYNDDGTQHVLHGYSEGLRDRLVTFFEIKGLKHKPKLIAMTSCSRGAGVTSLAAGLAASLSETGEGNVLLVDLNMERGAAHPFYRGKPASGLVDVLEGGERPTTKVNEKLYMVHGGTSGDRLMKVVPQRLAHLLPKLQQSDYDYIIFDMPPITQTSVTPRLAGFMDMVFVVVEAEKTNREWLKQATGLLKQSNANVAAVFNKRRDYTPRWLHQEF